MWFRFDACRAAEQLVAIEQNSSDDTTPNAIVSDVSVMEEDELAESGVYRFAKSLFYPPDSETMTHESLTTLHDTATHFHLSKAALGRTLSPRTLHLQGHIRELTVTILIDSGRSHNIIQPRIAEFLNFPIVEISMFSVLVGNSESIQCNGNCPNVSITRKGNIFQIPFYVLPIHGADVVFGVQWLQTLGRFMSDYTVPLIQFSHNDKTVTLTGSTQPTPKHASFAQFSRFMFTDSIEHTHTVSLTTLEPNLKTIN